MLELLYEKPEIYRMLIPLPENPLKTLNSYLIKLENRNLLIDTGFNRPECHEALIENLKELNVDMEKTDIFLTHLHSDHTGLINKIAHKNSKVYIGKIDYEYMFENLEGFNWEESEKRFASEGFPYEIIERLRDTNQAKIFAPDGMFESILVEDGYKFNVDKLEFTVILTSGHTPGHTCLYLEKEKLLFSGDHILFDITPNITSWLRVKDSLRNYIESLEKIKKLEITKTFPGHRATSDDVYSRIDEIIEHHKSRLTDTLEVIKNKSAKEGLTAYEIASFMKWNMRGKSWTEFPDNQKWFAVGETLSHLDYLFNENKIEKFKDNDMYKYKLT
ncbi:glyoxylase-like metal-dependent hydrolase (beta-lactamase superfamily II) [Fusobacterium sp. PH5-7]|uniref:MBL fold metallo-hydrolase n=1 Tax=Fusobacterium sp. PH5-7 TaxID=2940528 RepID=UPI002474EDA7|nr:MBL fold metallo-hydrolase [Fusobacterium sp. PH5-7]MDH6459322.1 glyoxylase-like metal-dependent hydrolase (beta-lactamase superfamily II) [Fusobacterium sp. PH5-7]